MTAPAAPAASSAAQAAQTGLVLAMAVDLNQAWAQLDVRNLRQSLPDFTKIIAAIIHKYGSAAGTLAARAYKAERGQADASGLYTVARAPLAGLSQIGQSIDWATQPLWASVPDLSTARTNVTGVAERLVLDVGRNTIVNNVVKDPAARGWARIPEPGCCSFCALLAIRGAIYTGQSGAFKSHDHCRCHVEPIFGRYEPSAQIRQWQALYRDSTTGGGAARARREWRRAFNAQQ